jgi:hypothetical protein
MFLGLYSLPGYSQVVISQVYGGGGNSGSVYTHDFIELFNRGNTAVDLTGWSVQYASATGTTWSRTNLGSHTLQPGQYYLIQQAAGSGGTTPLPTPDATGTIAMAATNGKVALVNTTTTLSGACPTDASIVDFVGFGTANCYEGAGATPVLSNTTAAIRADNGCTDTDDNAADFTTGAPTPRNTASVFYVCGAGTPPSISNIVQTPSSGIISTTTVSVSADVTAGTAAIDHVELRWGTASGVYPGTIGMTLDAGNTYDTDNDIPAQADGTTVYYIIFAEDEDGLQSASTQQSYEVRNPRYATIPYFEGFDLDLGDAYAYSVSGDSKWWIHDEFMDNGSALMNGYDSGDVEDDWLVLPGFNLDLSGNEVLQFDTRYRFGIENADNYLKLFYSTDYAGVGDPNDATWTELGFDKPAAASTWAPSGAIDLSGISGNSVWFAFQYRYEPGNYRAWQVDNVLVYEGGTPVNYPTQFKATVESLTSIRLSWQDAVPPATHYLIKGSTGGFAGITAPADGTMTADGLLVRNVPFGVEEVLLTGLNPNTRYYFKIFPYNGAGASASYLTTEPVPLASVRTTADGENVETFDNLPLTGSTYVDGSFLGNNGITWNYIHVTGAQDYEIDGQGMLLRRVSSDSKIVSMPIPGGISRFSVDLRKAFTGSGVRQVELFINGVSYGTSIEFGAGSGLDDTVHKFEVTDINVAGEVVIELRNISASQMVIDNLSWSPYEAPPVPVPLGPLGILLAMGAMLLSGGWFARRRKA